MEKQKADGPSSTGQSVPGPSLIDQIAQLCIQAGMTLDDAVQELKTHIMMAALQDNQGNVCRTARALGHHRNTVSRLLEELKLREFAASCRSKVVGRLPAVVGQRRTTKKRPSISPEHRLDQSHPDKVA